MESAVQNVRFHIIANHKPLRKYIKLVDDYPLELAFFPNDRVVHDDTVLHHSIVLINNVLSDNGIHYPSFPNNDTIGDDAVLYLTVKNMRSRPLISCWMDRPLFVMQIEDRLFTKHVHVCLEKSWNRAHIPPVSLLLIQVSDQQGVLTILGFKNRTQLPKTP